MVRIAFLFDYKSLLRRITPVFKALEYGSSNELRKLAMDTGTNNPKIWKILDYYGFYPKDDDFEEKNYDGVDGRVAFWLILVMAEYCSIIDNPVDPKTIGEALRPAGIDEETILMLAKGKPFSNIFLSLAQTISKDATIDNILGNIDDYPAGWLNIEDIKTLEAKLRVHREQINHPAFERLQAMLDTAIQSRQGLILGVAI